MTVMATMHTFDPTAVLPARADICLSLKLPLASPKYDAWMEEATRVFTEMARPIAIVNRIPGEEFRAIFEGEGLNESATPIGTVFPAAHCLALFAATVGAEVSRQISRLFESGQEVKALFLDTVASRAAENLVELLKEMILRKFKAERICPEEACMEAYSPGYCGWHVSGQRKLFDGLHPEEIGITLNESCLMEPLKSVSGVLVFAKKEYFLDEDVYPFCAACAHRSCEERKRRMESCNNS
jgi:hypothetical protein